MRLRRTPSSAPLAPSVSRRAFVFGTIACTATAGGTLTTTLASRAYGASPPVVGEGKPAPHPYPGHVDRLATLPPWNAGTSTASPPGNMLMFRGNPAHTYYGTGPLPTAAAPKVAWKFRMSDLRSRVRGVEKVWRGTGWTGQSLKLGDYVYVGSTGGHFHCFHAESGALVWVSAAHAPFKGSACIYEKSYLCAQCR